MLLNNASEKVTRDRLVTRDRFSSNHMSDDDVAGFSLALDDEFKNDCLKTGRASLFILRRGKDLCAYIWYLKLCFEGPSIYREGTSVCDNL